MKGKRICQINNLVIYKTKMYGYAVWSPDGRCLDDRMTFGQAKEFCQHTLDFCAKNRR